jgi:hypothetical protein
MKAAVIAVSCCKLAPFQLQCQYSNYYSQQKHLISTDETKKQVLVKMTSAILHLIGTNEISAYILFLRFCETNSFIFNPTSNKKRKRKTNESEFIKLIHVVVCVMIES